MDVFHLSRQGKRLGKPFYGCPKPNVTKFCSSSIRDLAILGAKPPITDRLRA